MGSGGWFTNLKSRKEKQGCSNDVLTSDPVSLALLIRDLWTRIQNSDILTVKNKTKIKDMVQLTTPTPTKITKIKDILMVICVCTLWCNRKIQVGSTIEELLPGHEPEEPI